MNNYAIISGSSREGSQSSRLSYKIQHFIETLDHDSQTDLIDLSVTKHQEWNNEFWGEKIPCPSWQKTSNTLAKASAIVIVVPEWHGMAPPALINLFMLAEHNEFSHKPALIVGVSSGNGGAYPVAQLRGFSSKNTKICFIPEHVIVRNVKDKRFEGDDFSQYDQDRLLYSLTVLKAYIPGFDQVRSSGILDYKKWAYGM
jgi:chromate reductase